MATRSWQDRHTEVLAEQLERAGFVVQLEGALTLAKSLHQTRTPAKDGTQGLLSEYLLFEAFALMLRTWARLPFSSSGRTM
jgi:hypothetical protein